MKFTMLSIRSLALVCRARHEHRARAGHQGRRDAFGHRAGGIARNSGAQHVPAVAADDRRKESQLHRARRRIGHDDRGSQCTQADQRRQGRCAGRLDGDAELARDDRRCGRKRNADDLDGGIEPHRRSGRRQATLGVQDAAERSADGAGHRRAHAGPGHQDGGLHRLRRRLRRRLVERVFEDRRDARPEGRRQRALSARRYVGDRTGAEAGQRQAGRDSDRGLRNAGGIAAERR